MEIRRCSPQIYFTKNINRFAVKDPVTLAPAITWGGVAPCVRGCVCVGVDGGDMKGTYFYHEKQRERERIIRRPS